VWVVRILCAFEVVDGLAFVADAGGHGLSPLLVVLMVAGVVGAVVAWVSHRPGVVAAGGLLTAIAPSIVYPLAFLLGLAAVALAALALVAWRQSR